ncbi:hypothetical protein JCM6882_009285 [Rhodosporidiobolus microsporus]
MFALPLQPVHPLSSAGFIDLDFHPHPSYNGLHADFLASHRHRQRQRQLALEEQAHRRQEEELARRLAQQEWKAEQAALAYRAALIRRAQAEELERRQCAARRRQVQLREQRRREDERRRIVEARRHFPSSFAAGPSFFDMLFQVAAHEEQGDDELDPPEIDLTASPSTFPSVVPSSSVADSVSPTLEASPAPSDLTHLTLSSDSSSTASDSDGESSASSSADCDASLATLSALSSSFDARRAAFTAPSTLSFQPSPSPDSRSPSPPLAFTSSNAPLLAYEDALVSLLSQIDAVESHGDADVRRARKDLVKRVEGELKRLDEVKEREWERQSSGSDASSASSSSGSAEEDAEMQGDESDSSEEQDDDSDASSFSSHADDIAFASTPFTHHRIPFALPLVSSLPPLSSSTRTFHPDPTALEHLAEDADDEDENEEGNDLTVEEAIAKALLSRRVEEEQESDSEDREEVEGVWLYL